MADATLGSAFALLYAGHQIGDYWVQTDHQAATKGGDGPDARRVCAAHVATLTLTQAVTLATGTALAGEWINPRRAVVGLAGNALTHYAIDRREPLRRLADLIGITSFHDLGKPRPGRDDNPCLGTGAHALDQALHVACLAAAAAYMTGGAR